MKKSTTGTGVEVTDKEEEEDQRKSKQGISVSADIIDANNSVMQLEANPMDIVKTESHTLTRKASRHTMQVANSVINNLSYKKHVRLGGFTILFMLLLIAIGHFVVFSIYANVPNTYSFQAVNKRWIWIFAVFSCLYLLRLVHVIKTWKRRAKNCINDMYELNQNNLSKPDVNNEDGLNQEEEEEDQRKSKQGISVSADIIDANNSVMQLEANPMNNVKTESHILTRKASSHTMQVANSAINKISHRRKSFVSKVRSAAEKVEKYYDQNFDINGKYYFYILYGGEFAESWIQLSNLIFVYSCTLPIGWSIMLAILLIAESSYRAKLMYVKLWGSETKINFKERNFQIVLDVTIDLFFLFVPLAILRFGFNLSIAVGEILLIVLVPSMTLFIKLPSIVEQIVLNYVIEDISLQQNDISRSFKRKRKSIFGASRNENVVEIQNQKFPYLAKIMVFVLSLVFAIGLSGLTILQVANLSAQDLCKIKFGNNDIWENGCILKIPYCKRIFYPKCNCASLYIEHDKTLITLPETLVYEMDGLRSFIVKDCNLTKLPKNMENLLEMVHFDVSFNNLVEFHVDVSKWDKLISLWLMYNKITNYNKKAVWTHKNLVNLALNNNLGMKISHDIKMPLLQFLWLSNNSMSIGSDIFNTNNFPSLFYLYVGGNTLKEFPDKSLRKMLLYLGVSRCNLTTFPLYMSDFTNLRYIDARNNNISVVDEKFKLLVKANNMKAYFSGNLACKLDKELDCQPLCSEYCWSRDSEKNDFCDTSCNSKSCDFDGGQCSA